VHLRESHLCWLFTGSLGRVRRGLFGRCGSWALRRDLVRINVYGLVNCKQMTYIDQPSVLTFVGWAVGFLVGAAVGRFVGT
jgi:hypothetical protein